MSLFVTLSVVLSCFGALRGGWGENSDGFRILMVYVANSTRREIRFKIYVLVYKYICNWRRNNHAGIGFGRTGMGAGLRKVADIRNKYGNNRGHLSIYRIKKAVMSSVLVEERAVNLELCRPTLWNLSCCCGAYASVVLINTVRRCHSDALPYPRSANSIVI